MRPSAVKKNRHPRGSINGNSRSRNGNNSSSSNASRNKLYGVSKRAHINRRQRLRRCKTTATTTGVDWHERSRLCSSQHVLTTLSNSNDTSAAAIGGNHDGRQSERHNGGGGAGANRIRSSSISSNTSHLSPHRSSTKVTKHLRKVFLTKIKTMQSKAKMNTNKLFEEITCAVCRLCHLDPYKVIPCGHSFCNWCLTEWLKQSASCPLCRSRPAVFKRDRQARAKVDFVCGRLNSERQLELGYGRELSEQQYCLISHKMRLSEFLNQVPQSAASQREADERREREYRQYETEVALLRVRIQGLRDQQEHLMRRRRRQISSVVERFETVLEALDFQEELLTMQLEQNRAQTPAAGTAIGVNTVT